VRNVAPGSFRVPAASWYSDMDHLALRRRGLERVGRVAPEHPEQPRMPSRHTLPCFLRRRVTAIGIELCLHDQLPAVRQRLQQAVAVTEDLGVVVTPRQVSVRIGVRDRLGLAYRRPPAVRLGPPHRVLPSCDGCRVRNAMRGTTAYTSGEG